jgi:hypothetical protein
MTAPGAGDRVSYEGELDQALTRCQVAVSATRPRGVALMLVPALAPSTATPGRGRMPRSCRDPEPAAWASVL